MYRSLNNKGLLVSYFANKNVMILGGSRGIGAAIVSAFAAAGAKVRFTYSGSKQAAELLAEKLGVIAVQADAADRSQVIQAVRDAGPLDVLIYNSGIIVSGDPREIDPNAVDRLFAINVQAPYHAAVEASRKMQDGGRILFIGSIHGDRMPFRGITAYGLSKSALQGMTRGFARDFGHQRITVNVIQPGPTNTDMNPADGPLAHQMHEQMAIKYHGTAEDVANLALYLAGPFAAGITGAMHTIDGGFGA